MKTLSRARARGLIALLLPLALASACEPVEQPDGIRVDNKVRLSIPFNPRVDLRADVNRDGTVDLDGPADEEGEDTWSAERGAIFLANIDDDQDECAFSFDTDATDRGLAFCHDAADAVVNGAEDLADLARLRTAPWPDAPNQAVGLVSVSGPAARRVRLFKKTRAGFVTSRVRSRMAISAAELRQGVELAIEASDIVRDAAVWDGFADVVFSISRSDLPEQVVRDTVRMRVAPVVLFHHLSSARAVFVSNITQDRDSVRFRSALRDALSSADVPTTLSEFPTDDLWTQDYFEPGYMAMPKPGGGQHVIRVNFRSANIEEPGSLNSPLRPAGRIVFWLRGPDEAAVQQYQLGMPAESQTLNSMGNTEVIPPYEKDGVKYPLGRLLRGVGPASQPGFQPDPSFTRMLESQAVQPPIYVDTSWLNVAHVDETLSFLPADTPRGWIALVADPAMARRMLLDAQARGHGDARFFTGLTWGFGRPAETTIAQALDNPGVMNTSAQAAVEIDAQLAILKAETGLTDEEIVRVPFLFQQLVGGASAYQPGTVNLLSVSRSLVVAPEPHGPVIDGKDLFKEQLEGALAPHGIRVHWTDTWELYHVGGGEVHCATQSAREIPEVKWWESGR